MQPAQPKESRNLWPVAIVVYFIVFGGFVISFGVYAMRQNVDLVSRDYYEDEIQFQKQMERIGRTASIQGQVAVNYDTGRQAITISLPAGHKQVSGLVRLYRPSDAEADLKVKLSLNEQGAQVLDATRLRGGLWKVRVQWTMNGEEYFYDQSVVIGPHRPS